MRGGEEERRGGERRCCAGFVTDFKILWLVLKSFFKGA